MTNRGCLAMVAGLIAVLIAAVLILGLVKLFDRGTETVRNPAPMGTPAAIAPCPPGHAQIARICVPRS